SIMERHLSGLRRQETEKDLQQGGFAGTVRADQRDELACAHGSRNVGENKSVPIGERNLAQLNGQLRIYARDCNHRAVFQLDKERSARRPTKSRCPPAARRGRSAFAPPYRTGRQKLPPRKTPAAIKFDGRRRRAVGSCGARSNQRNQSVRPRTPRLRSVMPRERQRAAESAACG